MLGNISVGAKGRSNRHILIDKRIETAAAGPVLTVYLKFWLGKSGFSSVSPPDQIPR